MWKRIVAVALLAAVARHLFIYIMLMGFHKTTYNHRPGVCSLVPGVESGAEALELLSGGIVLISAGYLTFKDRVPGAPRGQLLAYNISRPAEGAKELQIKGNYDVSELHPHGISAYEDKKTGKTFFFVINHHVGFDTVDIFEFKRNPFSLLFIKSIGDPLIVSVNSLVAIGPDEFYVTNEARTLNPKVRFWEDLLMLRGGSILFCDARGCRTVSARLNFPNGIDLSRNGRYLYVAQTFQQSMAIFERNPRDNSLKEGKPVQVIDLGTVPDNVYVDTSGDLWVGCIPVPHRAKAYLDAHQGRAPSQVLRVRLGADTAPHQDYALDEVYSEEHGINITMSTSAVYHEGILLIGSLHETMMRCDVTAL